MSFRRRLRGKKLPPGFDKVEAVIDDFEAQMRDAVNEDGAGKRKAELNWKVHRVHWEKNRFVFDLMYVRKVMSRELVRLERRRGGRRAEAGAGEVRPALARALPTTPPLPPQYDFLVREKIADGALIAKWRKPGYELLCSLLAVQANNHNFGTTSHCRVPLRQRAPAQRATPDPQTGCLSCASCDGRFGGPVWWNTPEEGEGDEGQAAAWASVGGGGDGTGPGGERGGDNNGSMPPPPSRKRPPPPPAPEDDLDDDVKARLAALKRANVD
jgi:bud site selection protein 31